MHLVFSPDGKWLVFALCEARGCSLVRIVAWDWRGAPSSRRIVLASFTGVMTGLAFSPDGTFLSAACVISHCDPVDTSIIVTDTKYVRVWHWQDGGPLLPVCQIEVENRTTVDGLSISHDNMFLAAACSDKVVRVWRLPSGQLHRTFTGHADIVTAVAFSPVSSDLVASASQDQTVQIWSCQEDATTPKLKHDGANMLMDVAFSRNGRWVITGDGGVQVRLWDPLTGQLAHCVLGPGASMLNAIAISGDEECVAVAGLRSAARYCRTSPRDKYGWQASRARIVQNTSCLGCSHQHCSGRPKRLRAFAGGDNL